MGRYIVRRLLWTVLVVVLVTLLTFVIFFVMPKGDPAIRFALKSPAFYLGCLGSTRTHAKRVDRLTADGFTNQNRHTMPVIQYQAGKAETVYPPKFAKAKAAWPFAWK